MVEATRLVREGRVAEATELLQCWLRGAQPDQPAVPERAAAESRIINVDPTTGELLGAAAPSSRARFHGTVAQRLMDRIRRQGPEVALPDRHSEVGQFQSRTYTRGTDRRPYKLFIPSTAPDVDAPLIVMLHGCKQSPDDFAIGTGMNQLAEKHGCLVAYPGQTRSANAQMCWNWFNPSDQRRDQGEPALIAGITHEIMSNHLVDHRRVYVAGLSAGGAAAAVLGQTYPDLYAAVGVHSGLPCGAASDVPSAFAAMRDGFSMPPQTAARRSRSRAIPTIVFHADRDHTVHPRNAEHIIAQSGAGTGLHHEKTQGQVPGGRAYTRSVYTDANGHPLMEHWLIHGAGHAWSGGSAAGSYTDPLGPNASQEMLRFFLVQQLN